MANYSLSDDALAFNTPNPLNNPPNDNLQDEVETNLAKVKALIAIAQCEGLSNCSVTIQHDYLSVLDDLVGKAVGGFNEMRKVKAVV